MSEVNFKILLAGKGRGGRQSGEGVGKEKKGEEARREKKI